MASGGRHVQAFPGLSFTRLAGRGSGPFGGGEGVEMAAERFEVVADFVELCSYCGAPCSGTVLVSYSDGGRRVAFQVDRPGLTLPIEELVGAAIEQDEYGALPAFVRDWNEGRGWAEFASDGAAVAADDLLRAVDALDRQRPAEDVRGGEMLAGLRAFVSRAAGEGREVWVEDVSRRDPPPGPPVRSALLPTRRPVMLKPSTVRPNGGGAMAIDFTGTNTEKTDKLVTAVVEQRTTLRLFLLAVGLGLPLLVGLQTSVVVELFRTTSKLDRLADQQADTQAEVRTLRTEVGRLAEQQAATQAEVRTVGERIGRVEQRLPKP